MIEGNALGALEGLGVAVSDEELNERVATVRADDLAHIFIWRIVEYNGGQVARRKLYLFC